MKKLILFATFISFFSSYAQYKRHAPWMAADSLSKTKDLSIFTLTNNFNEYWKNKDYQKKGSGYKPYKRWEYHWKNKTNPQGFLITPQEMWEAFNNKKNRKTFSTNAVPPSNWEPIGPFTHTNTGSWSSGQGRVNVVYVDPTNSNTLYIGSPAGGIWKSVNGENWIPLSDNLPQIGISGIAIDPNNANVIYISTGDTDANDTYSVGVLKSTDGGQTWNTTGLTYISSGNSTGDIVMNPSNSNMLWVATSNGLYRTTNGGTTWSVAKQGDFSQGRIRLKPGDPTTVYACSDSKFYRSTNSGTTFTNVTSGLPSSSNRLILDVTAANSNYVYVMSAGTGNGFQGIYKSINGGLNFTKTSGNIDVFDGSTQAWYDMAFAVSQTNAEELYTGCLNVWKSTDGGVSAFQLNNWSSPTSLSYTHADIHYLRFFGDKLYCGSDGGVYVSQDNGNQFTDLTASAQISQFYKVAVSKQTASKMVGGLQDNGGHAYSDNQWKNYYGADGMDTAIDPTNSNLFYGFIQNGGSLYISNNAGNSITSGVASPSGENGNWVTPLRSNSLGEIYAGYSNLFKIENGAWVQQNSASFGSGNIDLVTIDPNSDNVIYVVKNTELYKSTDKGINFNLVYNASSAITSVNVHSTDSNIIYITTQGVLGLAMKSTNGGSNFTSINQGIPNIGKNVILHQGRNPNNPVFVGTSLGVYYRDDTMTQFEPFDTNLPNVSVTDLEVNLEDEKIIAATYGRGIWTSSIVVATPLFDIKATAIPSPIAYNISCDSDPIIPQVVVKNNGTNLINNVDFTYSINNINYTYTFNEQIASGAFATVSLPQVTLSTGAYTLIINATTANDAFNDNNVAKTNFYINVPGTVNSINTFENGTDELLEFNDGGNGSGLWTRGVRTGNLITSGTNNVYTTTLQNNYPDVTKAFLVSKCYNLTQLTNPVISFKMAFDLEINWDIIYVQYSTDFGANWQVLGTQGSNWYNSDRTPQTAGNDCNNCIGAQWTGTDAAFKTYSYGLNDLNNFTNVIFRIVFVSDDAVNQEGAIVDDFLISGTLSTQNFEIDKIVIAPNPSKGIFTIHSGNIDIDKLEVFELTGKIIKTETDLDSQNFKLDLTNVASGIYFVKITSNQQTTVKRIIKN